MGLRSGPPSVRYRVFIVLGGENPNMLTNSFGDEFRDGGVAVGTFQVLDSAMVE